MKPLILIFSLSISLSTLAQTPGWQASFNTLVESGATGLKASTEQLRIARAVSELKGTDFENAISELGQKWQAYPEQANGVLMKIQTYWEANCFSALQIEMNKSRRDLLDEGSYLAAGGYLASLVKPAYLPYLIATYAITHTSTAQASEKVRNCPRAPFEILYNMAAPRKMLDEVVAREQDVQLAQIAVLGVSAASNILYSTSQVAKAASALSFSTSKAAQFLIFSALAYGGYKLIQEGSLKLRDSDVSSHWEKAQDALEKSLKTSLSDGSNLELNLAVRSAYLAATQLASFYQYNIKESATGNEEPVQDLFKSYESQCQTTLDSRLLIQAISEGKSAEADNILRYGNLDLNWQVKIWLVRWNYERTGKTGFSNFDEMQKTKLAFFQGRENGDFLRTLNNEIKTQGGNCRNGPYFLYTVAEYLDVLASKNGEIFERNPSLAELRSLIKKQFLDAYKSQKTMVTALAGNPYVCRYPQHSQYMAVGVNCSDKKRPHIDEADKGSN